MVKIFEILTTTGGLLVVKSRQGIEETVKLLKDEHEIKSFSYTELDTSDVTDEEIDYTF